MRRTELVAIMPGAGPPDGHAGCRVVRAEAHAALLRAAPLLRPSRNAQVLRGAAEHARLLEGLMSFGTVLPVLTGQHIRAPEVPRLFTANQPALARLGDRLAGRAQYQVTVRWDAERAPAQFCVPPQADTVAGLAEDLHLRIGAHLAATGAETLALPIAGDMISNHAVLIDQASEAALDAAVQKIDAIWSDGFALRMVGPYPAVSFASLVFDRIGRPAIRAAQEALALSPGFSVEALRQARREALLRATPGAREKLRWQAEALACAARLGSTDHPLHVARIWSDGMSAPFTGEAWAA